MTRNVVVTCFRCQRVAYVIVVAFGMASVVANASSMGGAWQESQPGPQATMTIADLMNGVNRRNSAVQDLTVSYRYDYAKGGPVRPEVMARTHQTITTKGEMLLLQRESWRDPSVDLAVQTLNASYDGRFSTTHLPQFEQATISDRRSPVVDTQFQAFFNMMMLNEPRLETGNGANDQSLISLLRNPNARLRPTLEEVNGQMTHVVEMIGEHSGEVELVVWIDPERGYLPVQQQFYRGGELSMEFEIEEAVEVWNQSNIESWYVTKGRKWIAAVPGIPGMEQDSNMVLEVDGWDTDEPQIVTNTVPIEDEEFRIWQDLPEGTMLAHADSRMILKVGADREKVDESVRSAFSEGSDADQRGGDDAARLRGLDPAADGSQGDSRFGDAVKGNGNEESRGDIPRSSPAGNGGSFRWPLGWTLGGLALLVAIVGVVVLIRRASS